MVLDMNIECMKKAGKRGLRAVMADASRLPFGDGCFDAVICSHLIEHVLSGARLVGEIYRLLRDGGLCFLVTPNRHRWTALITRFVPMGDRTARYPMNPDHIQEYTANELTDLLQSMPFRKVEVSPLRLHIPGISHNGRSIGVTTPIWPLSLFSNLLYARVQK